MITTAKMTKPKSITITSSDIKSMMTAYSSKLIVLFWSSDVKRNIYDELILRLCQTNVVAVARIDTTMNDTQAQLFMLNILNMLKNSSMIKYRVDISVTQITLIGHRTSCSYILTKYFTESKNKIILIDPVLNTTPTSQKDNINVIVFSSSSYDSSTRQKITTITANTYTLPNTDPDMIFVTPSSDMSVMNTRSENTTRLVVSINEIINE